MKLLNRFMKGNHRILRDVIQLKESILLCKLDLRFEILRVFGKLKEMG